MTTFDPRHKSRTLYEGRDRAPARSYLKAIGFNDADLARPIVGVARLDVEVSESVLRERLSRWRPPAPRYTSGVMAKYAALVSSASEGAITRPQ